MHFNLKIFSPTSFGYKPKKKAQTWPNIVPPPSQNKQTNKEASKYNSTKQKAAAAAGTTHTHTQQDSEKLKRK